MFEYALGSEYASSSKYARGLNISFPKIREIKNIKNFFRISFLGKNNFFRKISEG